MNSYFKKPPHKKITRKYDHNEGPPYTADRYAEIDFFNINKRSKAVSMGFDWNFIWILWDAIARPWASFGIVSGSYETSLREHVDPILVVLGLHLVLTELRWDSFGIPWVYIWIFWCSFGFVWASLPGCLGTQHRFFWHPRPFFWHPFWVPKGPSAR